MEIQLGTKTAILLAIECFIEHSKYAMQEPISKDELIYNIEAIFSDEKKQRHWIEKSFPQTQARINPSRLIKVVR
jgi:hypothetical protein